MRDLRPGVLRLVLLIATTVLGLLAVRFFVAALRVGGVAAGAAIALLVIGLVAGASWWYASRRRRRRFEAFIVAHTHEVDDEDDEPVLDDPDRIRRQVYELTLSDIRAEPIWEHALDEEGVEGQDEATVRPRADLRVADPREGMLIARSSFEAADGTRYTGYVYPSQDQDPGLLQPTIVTDDGQVDFWLGAHDAIGPDDLRPLYALLGKTAEELFPLTYRADVPTGDVPVAGTIRGFMWRTWRTWRSGTPRESR